MLAAHLLFYGVRRPERLTPSKIGRENKGGAANESLGDKGFYTRVLGFEVKNDIPMGEAR